MGLCQSHPSRRKGGDPFYYVDGGSIPLAKDGNCRHDNAVKSTPRGGKRSSAYDLALISPSERTGATGALSPTSMYSPALSNISPIKKEKNFDFVIEVYENDNFAPQEGLEDLRSRIVMDSFSDGEVSGFGVEKRESFKDEDNHGLDSHDFMNSLTTKYNEFTGKDQMIQDDANDRCDLPDYRDIMDKYSHRLNIAPILNQGQMANSVESTKQSNGVVDKDCISSKPENGGLDQFDIYGMNSKHVPTPLLVPPRDVPVETQPSNTYTAVNPSIVASFNKMKTEVNELQKQEKQRRQEEKIKDRRQDIKGYMELWGEYSEIQKRVFKQHSKNNKKSPSPNKEDEKISLADSTTWFVDFSTLKPANDLGDVGSVHLGTADGEDHKKQTNLPFLIESSAFYSRQNAFGLEELWQRKTLRANHTASDVTYASSSSHLNTLKSTATSQNDHENGLSENDESNNIPDTMDLDLRTRSMVSDLGNGSNSSMASDIEGAFGNDDYGVLRRYSRKSIESTVLTHTENFNAQLGNQDFEDSNALLSARKALVEYRTASSFSKYLAKNCLPSVSIENAETGLIRWRKSPKNDVEA